MKQELLTARAFTNSSGRLQIFSKKEWRELISRSPDRLDSCVLAIATDTHLDLSAAPRHVNSDGSLALPI